MKSFSGTKIQDLKHYVTPYLEHYKPNISVIHMESSSMSYNNLVKDASILIENTIRIGKKSIEYGVEKVIISSFFVKETIKFSSVIRKVNDELSTTN